MNNSGNSLSVGFTSQVHDRGSTSHPGPSRNSANRSWGTVFAGLGEELLHQPLLMLSQGF